MRVSVTSAHWSVGPDFGAVGGAGSLRQIIGALLTYGLLCALAVLIVCTASWAIASANGNWHTATKARTGVLVALGGATMVGALIPIANWLLDLGSSL